MPASFSSLHQGDSCTLHLPCGTFLRRDFVAVPQSLKPNVSKSYVESDFLLATARDDHFCVAIEFTMSCPRNHDVARPQKFTFNREALNDPSLRGILNDALLRIAATPWQINAHTHVSVLTQQPQDVLIEKAPMPKRLPRPEWIPVAVWKFRDAIIDAQKSRRTSAFSFMLVLLFMFGVLTGSVLLPLIP